MIIFNEISTLTFIAMVQDLNLYIFLAVPIENYICITPMASFYVHRQATLKWPI